MKNSAAERDILMMRIKNSAAERDINKKFCCRAGHFDDAMVEDAAMLRVRNASAVNSQVSRGIQV